MGFLDNYETVNQKVQRLHATWPTNRIETSIIDWSPEKGYILIECRIYRKYEDEKPAAIDYAHGMVGAYNVQMKRWYVEDTVSSAIGRCASVVLGTDDKVSKESMEQVETMPKSFIDEDPWNKPFVEQGFTTAAQAVEIVKEQIGSEVIEESPLCAHGHMILKTGEKNGNPYRGFVCSERDKKQQCSAIWYRLESDGKWRVRI